MTDLVVGGGAVGSLVGWALAAGGRDVAIVRRGLAVGAAHGRPDRRRARPRRERIATVTEVARPEDLPRRPSVIVFAVKMFDLEAAAQSCAAWPDARRR